MGKKKLTEEFLEQNFYNGIPCGHEKCGKSEKDWCPYCGRTMMRGNTIIQPRTGFVHLERLNSSNIKSHNLKSPEEQETSTIKLWIGPNLSY